MTSFQAHAGQLGQPTTFPAPRNQPAQPRANFSGNFNQQPPVPLFELAKSEPTRHHASPMARAHQKLTTPYRSTNIQTQKPDHPWPNSFPLSPLIAETTGI
ncbi:hypothetical protein CsSME_00011503 [Camellia sinensis var. sinensis]